ncbi:hypothetical protein [Limosilactobacillus reuteri]|nr:hypothetical protein [Limosilactobacillus reuteri]
MPTDFFNTSFSDYNEIQNAKSRKDREVDPEAFARSLEALL